MGNRMKLAIIGAIFAPLLFVFGAVAPAGAVAHAHQSSTNTPIPAQARRDEGPFTINTENGNMWYVGSADRQPNTNVVQVVKANARNMFYHHTGFDHNGQDEGYIKFSNGNPMASRDTCDGVTIKGSTSDNGTVWIEVNVPGDPGIWIVNRRCDGIDNIDPEYSQRLAANNQLGDHWTIGHTGLYTFLLEHPA